ncbi:MAG: zinc-dependent alcohol dehydrogenase family protein [Anaerolineae bacterium]|nr:zinc-dependent alcohol dehydrogenase family protein [Anaerolineae bacterium]
MRAMQLTTPAPVETKPLHLLVLDHPVPAPDHLLVRVLACGVCHTDLHLVEGELQNPQLPIIPGHEIVGVVESVGAQVTRFQPGTRVGIPWLHETCGVCEFYQREQENLCEKARFTGYTAQGGYAEYTTVHENFAVPVPENFSDVEAAPLLCAGIVGYRSLRLSDLQPGERLGLYGFGASAHIGIQVANYWGCEVFVFTRSTDHQKHALELGAKWVGQAHDSPPVKLDRAIIFAPAGWIVPQALGQLRKGGTLCINAIHMSDLPVMRYSLLWHERTIRSVANATRRDAEEFMRLAGKIPLQITTQTFDLDEANHALLQMKTSQIKGSGVLRISQPDPS